MTSHIVIRLCTLSSVLTAAFAFGLWRASGQRGALRWLAVMLAANAADTLVLWNVFPMHMRGVSQYAYQLWQTALAVVLLRQYRRMNYGGSSDHLRFANSSSV